MCNYLFLLDICYNNLKMFQTFATFALKSIIVLSTLIIMSCNTVHPSEGSVYEWSVCVQSWSQSFSTVDLMDCGTLTIHRPAQLSDHNE